MPAKKKSSPKSSGIEIISMGVPSVSAGKDNEICSYDRGAWASNAKVEDLLFILDNAPFGVILNKGESGDVVYQNPALIRISGYPASEAGDVESALKAMTPDHVDLQAKMEKLRQIEEAGGGIFLDEIKTKDGLAKIIEMRTIVLPDKTRVGMFIDVTRREEAEKALREINIDLESRVGKRTAELKEINKKLRREIKERRKAEKELEHSREELRLLSEHLQRDREEERLSIAREVHDELGQLLSVMKIDTSLMGQNLSKHPGHLKKQIESFENQIDAAIQAVRDICARLRPSVLMHFGLSAAIEWYLEDLRKRTGINCISQILVDVPVEETELSLVLFRIMQEATTNILRHAGATEIIVSLTAEDDDIILKIRDNGRGITAGQMMKPQSFGIIGIRERVRFWGGTSTFEGVPDNGTTVAISIPLKKTNHLSKTRAVSREREKEKSNMIKVLIVDDHMIFREGIKRVLAAVSDIEVAGEAGSGKEAMLALTRNHYDVVLQDLALPDIDGLDLLRRIKSHDPHLPVLVLSFYPEDQYAVRVLKEGASGYLTKESVPNDLINAIRKAAEGGKYISASLGESLARSVTGEKERRPHELLSNREYQIFSMIAGGKSIKEMSSELSIARTTITSYRSRIFEKLKFKTNADLIRYAVENHIV